MSPLEKCCWYWTYINEWIEAEVVRLDLNRCIARIEIVNGNDLHEWAFGEPAPRFLAHLNGAPWSAKSTLTTWTEEDWQIFNRIAGDTQRKLYTDIPHAAQQFPMYNEIVLARR
jgi:hypothetical protein